MNKKSILKSWDITYEEIDSIITANPSSRGMLFGYVAEYKARTLIFNDPRFSSVLKPDDHDRTDKSDLGFIYNGVKISIEIKSLQTNSVKDLGNDNWKGTFQCDASDKRKVQLPNGNEVETTCLLVGEFDLVVVNLFAFGDKWRFAFARNKDLPRTTSKKYRAEDQQYLLKSGMGITFPLGAPFEKEPFRLLDQISKEKASQKL